LVGAQNANKTKADIQTPDSFTKDQQSIVDMIFNHQAYLVLAGRGGVIPLAASTS